MTRGGKQDLQDDPERKCIVTGESQPKAGLVRFCIGPDDMVVPDILGRLPGRGIYVAANREAITKAATKGLFSRAARQPVKVPDGLADLVEALLTRRVVELISMARKANSAVMGYEKVKDWLSSGKARVLVQASDGSERGKTKLRPPRRKEWLYRLSDCWGIGFGIRSGTCDTRRAWRWWTHDACCRGSGKAFRFANCANG